MKDRKSYEISQISAEAPEIVDSMFDAPELVSSSLVQGAWGIADIERRTAISIYENAS